MHNLELSLLGSLAITVNGKPIEVASNFVRALFCYLAIDQQPHRREALAEMLWPEKPEGVARNSLKQALSNLRTALGDRDNSIPFLLVSRDEIQFNQSSPYWIDAAAFIELIDTCEAHDHDDAVTCKSCEDRLLRAIKLYRGDFLADFYLPDNRDFNDWVLLKREVFQRGMSTALCNLAEIYEARQEYARASDYRYQLAEIEPWNEENHRNLMHLLALNGMRSLALRQYHTCRKNLENELGVETSHVTIALYEEIKAWAPGAFTDQAPSRIQVDQTRPTVDPIIDGSSGSSALRKPMRWGLFGLIAAALILGIGSIHWAGLPNLGAKVLAPNAPQKNQIPLASSTGTQGITPEPTENRAAEIAIGSDPSPTPTRTLRPTRTLISLESIQSLLDSGISESEIAALKALYEGMDGHSWENAEGWLSDQSPCDWFGVTCRVGKIVELELEHNQLKGSIPAEIGQLENLENLDLGDNQLSGPIPPELGDLSKLVHLTLWGNHELSDSIPPELGKLSHLEYLQLAHGESGGSLLSGEIPPELGNLKELRVMQISGSLLQGPLPDELCGLTSLVDLYLDSNRLSGPIPPKIGNLTSLGALDLGGNDIEGPIPPELGDLSTLAFLALGGNLLYGEIPAELGSLVRLRYIALDNMDLSGPLPLTLMNLNLRHLSFYNTRVCEPDEEAFQAWLESIFELESTDVVCESEND